jgi:phosphoglycerate dehydrogenase-like enzyme
MNEARVAVTFDVDEAERAAVRETLEPLGGAVFLSDQEVADRAAALRRAEVLMSWFPSRELTDDDRGAIGGVRLVQLVSAGADHVDFASLPPHVLLAGNVGAFAEPMAEHVLGMSLALAKRLPLNLARLAAGEYPADPATLWLRGGVAGIVGFGGIGRASARLLRCVGMRIHALNTSGRTDEDVEFVGGPGDLEAVLRAADVLVIAAPLTRHTRGMIGARELAWMKPAAILVNVARAAIVDERALYEHLRSNPEFSAGIDVWWNEPPRGTPFTPALPFLDLPNVLGSPHNSGNAPGVQDEAAAWAARNVARFLRGEPILGVQRPEDYRPPAAR